MIVNKGFMMKKTFSPTSMDNYGLKIKRIPCSPALKSYITKTSDDKLAYKYISVFSFQFKVDILTDELINEINTMKYLIHHKLDRFIPEPRMSYYISCPKRISDCPLIVFGFPNIQYKKIFDKNFK